VSAGGRRILVAGAMLELGAESATLHAACGQAAAKAGVDVVIGVSGDAQALAEAARDSGVETLFFETPEQAGKWLKTAAKPGDVVLLKASRGVRLERALDAWRG
jgi:UDP-N-acetylmuramoyl-tripeptide--D-alanyl-D-alanine ligase